MAIIIMMLFFLCFILDYHQEQEHMDHKYTIIRGAGIVLFDAMAMMMLIPLRTIGVSPNFKDHFKGINGRNYLRCFRWMCFLNICNMTYSALFIIDQFGDSLSNPKRDALRGAFALSFGSIYFSVWSLSQWFPWIVPNEYGSATLNTYTPAIHRQSESSYFTQCIINGDGCEQPLISPISSRTDISNQIKRHKFRAKSSNDLDVPGSFDLNQNGNDGNEQIEEKYQDIIQLFRNEEYPENMEMDNVSNQLAIVRSFAYTKPVEQGDHNQSQHKQPKRRWF